MDDDLISGIIGGSWKRRQERPQPMRMRTSARPGSLRNLIESDDDDDNVRLNITDQSVNLDNLDIHNIDEPKIDLLPDLLIDEIEILE